MSSYRTAVKVGAEVHWVEGEDWSEHMEQVSAFNEIALRVVADAQIRTRRTPDKKGKVYTYLEFYSPRLKASKSLSRLDTDLTFPYAVLAKAPWIRLTYKEDGYESYGGYHDFVPYGQEQHGFVKPNVFYPIEPLLEDGKKVGYKVIDAPEGKAFRFPDLEGK